MSVGKRLRWFNIDNDPDASTTTQVQMISEAERQRQAEDILRHILALRTPTAVKLEKENKFRSEMFDNQIEHDLRFLRI